MITYKVLDDGTVDFLIPAGSVWISEDGDDKLNLDFKELIELGKAINSAKFDWCSKFKCCLDKPVCF